MTNYRDRFQNTNSTNLGAVASGLDEERKRKLFSAKGFKVLAPQDDSLYLTEAESERFVKAFIKQKSRYIPQIDYKDPSTFAFFGSAEKYYEDSISNIYNTYPYDGSKAEKMEWSVSASYIDLYILEHEYPKSAGHVIFDRSSDSITDDTHYPTTDNVQYIKFSGGPQINTIYNSSKNREGNLKLNGTTGNTFEFWLKKDSSSWYSNTGRKEVIFDICASVTSSADQRGRFTVELENPASSSDSPILFTYLSGTTGATQLRLGSSDVTKSTVADGEWHHYAITAITTGSSTEYKLYVDGTMNYSTVQAHTLEAVDRPMTGTIGSLSSQTYAGNGALGTGKLSGSLDEVRFWKKARTEKEIGRFWYQPIHGGTDADHTNASLGLYYKFNEGVTSTEKYDKVVLDYSGRINNGEVVGWSSGFRSTISGITLSSNLPESNFAEVRDPIINPNNSLVVSVLGSLKNIGKSHDLQNQASLLNTVPEHFRTQDVDLFPKLLQVLSSTFDDLFLKIKNLPEMKSFSYNDFFGESGHYRKGQDNNFLLGCEDTSLVEFTGNNFKPWTKDILEHYGLVSTDIFSDATIFENFFNRSEQLTFEHNLEEVKRAILSNIHKNLVFILKTKGTETSFRNLIRCFGVDDELIKLNVYGQNEEYKLELKPIYTSLKKKAISFEKQNFQGTVYQRVDGTHSTNYITGASSQTPFTLEANIMFPRQTENTNPKILESSLFGIHSVSGSEDPSDPLVYHAENSGSFQVYFKKRTKASKDGYFVLTSSAGVITAISSSYIPAVYDDEHWNIALSIGAKADIDFNVVPSTSDTQYLVELRGYNYDLDILKDSFHISASLSRDDYVKISQQNKAVFLGSHKTHFSGTHLMSSDVRVFGFNVWKDILSDEEHKEHAKNPETFGRRKPASISNFDTGINLQAKDSLILRWQFENLSSSNGSNQLLVEDFTSGSAASISTDPVVGYMYPGLGVSLVDNENAITQEFIPSVTYAGIDNVHSSDRIKIKSLELDKFEPDSRPVTYFYSFEKSMYQVVSKEMANFFAGVIGYNNLIGEPVNKYRSSYKAMEKVREKFFANVNNDLDLEKFVEFYRWIDSSLSGFLNQLTPASAHFGANIRDVVESHILERNKYKHQPPTIEFKDPADKTYPIMGVNELLYDWEHGHYSSNEDEHCLWQRERSPRTGDRETLRRISITEVSGSTYALRRLTKPYKLSGNNSLIVGTGLNKKANKNTELYKVINSGKEIYLTSSAVLTQKVCNDVLDPNAKTFIKSKIDVSFTEGYLDVDSDMGLPFTMVSSSAGNSLATLKQDLQVSNNHLPIGQTGEVPLQGPFTSTHIGSMPHRRVSLGTLDKDRPEAYSIGIETSSVSTFADIPSKAIRFVNDSSSYIEIDHSTSFHMSDGNSFGDSNIPFAISFWVYPDSAGMSEATVYDSDTAGKHDILVKGENYLNYEFAVGIGRQKTGGAMRPYLELKGTPGNARSTVEYGRPLNNEQWNHVVVTYNAQYSSAAKIDIYVNNGTQASYTGGIGYFGGFGNSLIENWIENSDQILQTTGSVKIGMDFGYFSYQKFVGQLADIIIFKNAYLNSTHVSELYAGGKILNNLATGSSAYSDVLAWYKMGESPDDNSTSNGIKDSVGSFHGTVKDSTLVTIENASGSLLMDNQSVSVAVTQITGSVVMQAPSSDVPKSQFYSHIEAASHANIRNIKHDTGSLVLGNYNKVHEIVRTNGRMSNNSHFVETEGSYVNQTPSSSAVTGFVDSGKPNRSRSGHVIVNKFSAPGGPETAGYFANDIESGEMSVYNTINYRNLNKRNLLSRLYSEASERSGYRTGSAVQGSLHKTYRNPLRQTGALNQEVEFDNFFISHHIPTNDFSYSWITASANEDVYSFLNKNENIGHQNSSVKRIMETFRAAVFTGDQSTSYVKIPHHEDLVFRDESHIDSDSTYMISFWMKRTSLSGTQWIAGKHRPSTARGFGMYLTSGNNLGVVHNDQSNGSSMYYNTTGSQFNVLDTWQHVVIIHDANNALTDPNTNVMYFYLNGVLVGQETENTSHVAIEEFDSTDFFVGTVNATEGSYPGFVGEMFDFTVFNGRRYGGFIAVGESSNAVAQLYNEGNRFDPTTHSLASDLVLWLKLGDHYDSESSFKDFSGNGHNSEEVGSAVSLTKIQENGSLRAIPDREIQPRGEESILFLSSSELVTNLDFAQMNFYATSSLNSSTSTLSYIDTALNSQILNLQGPYGWPTWKQLRGQEHPVVRDQKKNNKFTISVRKQYDSYNQITETIFPKTLSEYEWSSNEDLARVNQNQTITKDKEIRYFDEVMVTNRFNPLTITLHGSRARDLTTRTIPQHMHNMLWSNDETSLVSLGEEAEQILGQPSNTRLASLKSTYGNNLTLFSNIGLTNKLSLKDVYKKNSTAVNALRSSATVAEQNPNVYSSEVNYIETLYPKEINTFSKSSKVRELFDFYSWRSSRSSRNVTLGGRITYGSSAIKSGSFGILPISTISDRYDYKSATGFLLDATDATTVTGSAKTLRHIRTSRWPLDARANFADYPISLTASYYELGNSHFSSRNRLGTMNEGILQNDYNTYVLGYNSLHVTPPPAPLYNRRIPQPFLQENLTVRGDIPYNAFALTSSLSGIGSVTSTESTPDYDFGTTSAPFSISFWFKETKQLDTGFLPLVAFHEASDYTDTQYRVYRYLNSGYERMYFEIRGNSGGYINVFNPYVIDFDADAWYNVVATFDGTTSYTGMNLYINGNNVSQFQSFGGTYGTRPQSISSKMLSVMNPPASAGVTSNGNNVLMADVAIFDVELSQAEVTELYNSGTIEDLQGHSRYANAVLNLKMGDGTNETETTTRDYIGSIDFDLTNIEKVPATGLASEKQIFETNVDTTQEFLSGEAEWLSPSQAGLNPFVDNVDSHTDKVKYLGQDYSLVPEFKISDHVEHIITREDGNFYKTSTRSDWLSLTGAVYHTSSNQVEIASNFYKTYATSDFMKYFGVVRNEVKSAGLGDASKLTLKCNAVTKFVPYRGFYPAERTVQISELFSRGYLPNPVIELEDRSSTFVNSSMGGIKGKIRANMQQSMKPLLSPGILYNSIKCGVAVDYPLFGSDSMLTTLETYKSGSRDTSIENLSSFPSSLSSLTNITGSLINSTVDTGIPRLSGSVYRRVTFEDLLDPDSLVGVRMYDQEPHPSASMYIADSMSTRVLDYPPRFGRLDADNNSNDLLVKKYRPKNPLNETLKPYKMAMQNFCAETVEFFLKDSKLSTIESQEVFPYLEESKEYKMRVYLRNNGLRMYDRHSAFGPPVDESGTSGIDFKSTTSTTIDIPAEAASVTISSLMASDGDHLEDSQWALKTTNETTASAYSDLPHFSITASNGQIARINMYGSGDFEPWTYHSTTEGSMKLDHGDLGFGFGLNPGDVNIYHHSSSGGINIYVDLNSTNLPSGPGASELVRAIYLGLYYYSNEWYGYFPIRVSAPSTVSSTEPYELVITQASTGTSGNTPTNPNNDSDNWIVVPSAFTGGQAAGTETRTTVATQNIKNTHAYSPFIPPFLDVNSEPYVEVSFTPTSATGGSKEYTLPEILANSTYTYVNFAETPSNTTDNSNYLHAMALSASLDLDKVVVYDADEQEPASERNQRLRWAIQTKWETPVLNFINATGSALNLSSSLVESISGSSPWQKREWSNFYNSSSFEASDTPYLTSSLGMWHQYGTLPTGDKEGYVLSVERAPDHPALQQLSEILGFHEKGQKAEVPLGRMSDRKTVSEAVVAIPFIETNDIKKPIRFFQVKERVVKAAARMNRRYKLEFDEAILNLDRNVNSEERNRFLREKEEYERFYNSPGQAPKESVAYQLRMMDKFILPPQFDYANNPDNKIKPMMYIFQFHAEFDKQDLSNIWQNLPPVSPGSCAEAKIPSSAKISELSSKISDVQYVSNFFDNSNQSLCPFDSADFLQNKRVRWLIFKVKQRAEFDLYNVKKKSLEGVSRFGKNINTSFSNFKPTPFLKNQKYSYNWPYDFFSIVELIKMESKVDFFSNANVKIEPEEE